MTNGPRSGFDLRTLDPALPQTRWDAARRELYLLNPRVERPLSLDRMVWPRKPLIAEPYTDFWTELPDLLAAAGALGPHDTLIAVRPLARDDREAATLDEAWRSLGFDVCDCTFYSALSNCGYLELERAAWRAAWASKLNAHGLLTNARDALVFTGKSDARVKEHAPFAAYEIFAYTRST